MNTMVLQGANHLEASAVSDVRKPWIFVATKIPLKNSPVLSPVEHGAPCLKFSYTVWRFLRVQFSHARVIQILATPHGVGEMYFPAVPVIDVCQCSRNSALGHHRVSLA